ncbi:hypothetical protein SAMN06265222_1184 [Neorhodopirellula lusitana]|uniref:Uncharacterized protein n=1 Tax=Neorhodopirellula lusitana TaxID=445327 RepID=A0ABY1QNJ4_9BACT|nr:hypothetical protein SAMN06265222_1184 [Neorhodopirellula lusitana]
MGDRREASADSPIVGEVVVRSDRESLRSPLLIEVLAVGLKLCVSCRLAGLQACRGRNIVSGRVRGPQTKLLHQSSRWGELSGGLYRGSLDSRVHGFAGARYPDGPASHISLPTQRLAFTQGIAC